MAVKAKFFWQSSTFWINFLGIVVIALEFVVQSNLIPDADVVAIVVAVLNLINRWRAPKIIQPLKLV